MRWNSEGIEREDLRWALLRKDIVRAHRAIDRCMLCRNPRVNEAGLCNACYSLLGDEDLKLAVQWMSGVGP